MKRILTKTGKGLSLIQRDGFGHAIKHAWWLWRESRTQVTEGHVLYVTSGIGDSALYRGHHAAEELRKHDFQVSVTNQDDRNLIRYIDRFHVFVLHRTMCTPRIMQFIKAAKKANRTILFETDDLTFDAELFKTTNAYKNTSRLERNQYSKGQSHCIVNDPEIPFATASTEPLAEALRERGKNVFVVPNKMSEHFVKLSEQAYQEAPKRDPRRMRIGYFSGTATHDRDFAVVTDTLLNILEKFPQVELLIVGPLELDKRFNRYKTQIIRKLYAPKKEHFANIASCNITLAPLEVGDSFCEAKSAIKFAEAALVRVPIVASATKAYEDAIEDGVTGYTATTANEWEKKLTDLILDHKKCETIGNAAYIKVIKHDTTRTIGNTAFHVFLRQKIDGIAEESIQPLRESYSHIDTAIVIATWNGKQYLRGCLDSLERQTDQSFHTIVAENGSTDSTLDMLKNEYPNISWIRFVENTGFARANNAGIRAALKEKHIRFIITLNNDTEMDSDYIAKIREAAIENINKGIASVQPKVLNYYRQKEIDATGVVTAHEFSAINRGRGEYDSGQYDDKKDILGPSASAALYTREALEKSMLPFEGYFDQDYFAYYEDVDLLWRLRFLGYKSIFVPEARVYHVHSATGRSYSPFKAFHIHRNHFYNLIKLAPFAYLFLLIPMMFWRYILLVMSVLEHRGASSKLRDNVRREKGDSMMRIVFRSWRGVWQARKSLIRKRKFIQKRRKISTKETLDLMNKYHIPLKEIIFK